MATTYTVDDCYPITDSDLRRPDAPRFEQFLVTLRSTATPAPVDLNSHPAGRRYGTVLRNGARMGANFAGHYTIVVWGNATSRAPGIPQWFRRPPARLIV